MNIEAQGLFGKFQEPEQSLVKQRTFANLIFPKVPHLFVAQCSVKEKRILTLVNT